MRASGIAAAAVLVVLAGPAAGPVAAQGDPLSAIDWLSRSLATPAVLAPERPVPGGAPEGGLVTEPVSVAPLDRPRPDAAGLLAPAITGLPRELWGPSPQAIVVELIGAERLAPVPALQELLVTLLLAEAVPPAAAATSTAADDDRDAPGERLLLARVDKLMNLGALEPAAALLEASGAPSAEAFRRRFDIALLLGQEDAACDELRRRPDIAPSFKARIFCLARSGDWAAAALSLETGVVLGHIGAADADLMARFLDPDLVELEPGLPPPFPMTPLTWRILEAVGEPVSTATLPLAFAQAELRDNVGWRARLEAGERLARSGALAANALLGLYTEGRPAASGGVWGRVAAMQRFDRALALGPADAVAAALAEVWPRMVAAGLEVPFAELYGLRLQGAGLAGDAAATAFEIGLLSRDYEAVALAAAPVGARVAFLAALARGTLGAPGAPPPPPGSLAAAVTAGMTAPALPESLAPLVTEGRLGEALLRAMAQIAAGMTGEVRAVGEGLALLVHVGRADTARRAALQLLLLERRG